MWMGNTVQKLAPLSILSDIIVCVCVCVCVWVGVGVGRRGGCVMLCVVKVISSCK